MKRLLPLLVTICLFCSYVPHAKASNAIDLKVSGQWEFTFGWGENLRFADSSRYNDRYDGKRDNDNFIARQRLRTQINFIASESLQGVLMFEIGDTDWGNENGNDKNGPGSGGSLGADGVNVETKRAYLDWMIPESSTSIRMGIQGLALPMATELGNPIFDDDVAGIVINYAINDMFALTAFWIRPYNYSLNDENRSLNDEVDAFGLILPITLDGWTLTPWGVWGNVGSGSGLYESLLGVKRSDLDFQDNDDASAWWAGLGVAVDMFDPLTFAVDIMYGNLGKNDIGLSSSKFPGGNEVSAHGWFIAANLDYKLDWGTPGLFGWWSSGDSKEGISDGRYGRIPAFPTSNGFIATSFGFDGAYGRSSCDVISLKGIGTWGVGVQIDDISFIEKLSHTIRFAYYAGTNDHEVVKEYGDLKFSFDGVYMTDKDSAYEINFNSFYQIHENLRATVELGYIDLDLDSDTWKHAGGSKTDNAYKAALSFTYQF